MISDQITVHSFQLVMIFIDDFIINENTSILSWWLQFKPSECFETCNMVAKMCRTCNIQITEEYYNKKFEERKLTIFCPLTCSQFSHIVTLLFIKFHCLYPIEVIFV